jgi:DNA-binding response OmpR family regulator
VPDLLITDYHLRDGVTGADVIRSVRKQVSDTIPVILISGDTSDAVIVKDLEGTSFLTKPVDTDQLLDEIHKQLERVI